MENADVIRKVKAVVTEVDDAGISRFRSTDLIEPAFVRTPVGDGSKERTGISWQVWGTSDGVPVFQDPAEPVAGTNFPGPGGTRFSVFSIPPDSSVTNVVDRPDESSGDALGVAATHETAGDAAFHTSNTIDYIFVVDGEIELELDGGRRELLTRGDCLVQRGTRHAWRNVSTAPAVMACVIVGVEGGR